MEKKEMITENDENLRTEYAALTSYSNQVVSFRFTLVGFYLAAIGLIASSELSKLKLLLLLWISITLWLLELRNRSLLFNLSKRGMQIERLYWGYRGKKAYEPFISHQIKEKPLDDPDAGEPPGHEPFKLFFWKIKFPSKYNPVTHSFALDSMYFGVIVITIFQLFK